MFRLPELRSPWFRAKRFGYGAGLPFTWQGWALFSGHMVMILGIAFALQDKPFVLVPVVMLLAFAPFPIYAARTEGGWKWRNGD